MICLLYTSTTSHSNTDQNIINKINNSISTASFNLVDNNELNEYVFLRNNVNYTIILNAPKNSDNLMVANHILDTKKKTEYTYSYLNGSASTSGFGYINTTDDKLFPLSGNNNGYYKVSDLSLIHIFFFLCIQYPPLSKSFITKSNPTLDVVKIILYNIIYYYIIYYWRTNSTKILIFY